MRHPEKDKGLTLDNEAGPEEGSLDEVTERHPNGGRPEVQGNRTGRNPCQPAPTWPRPPGNSAADALARALRRWQPPRQQFQQRRNGGRR
jgi:hypothetical protein